MSCNVNGSQRVYTYKGRSEINFFIDNNDELSVTIEVKKLYIRSAQAVEAEYNRCANLFRDANKIGTFCSGQIETEEKVRALIDNVWMKQWCKNDPYAGLAVFNKERDNFLGVVALSCTNEPGVAALSYFFHTTDGRKSITAVVKEYAIATIKQGYKLEGSSLRRIEATVRADHIDAQSILKEAGMFIVYKGAMNGILTYRYAIGLNDQQKKLVVEQNRALSQD